MSCTGSAQQFPNNGVEHAAALDYRVVRTIGLLLILLGAFVVFRGVSYRSKDEVLRVGDLKASVEEKRAVPAWVGGLAIVAGVVMLAGGMKRRT